MAFNIWTPQGPLAGLSTFSNPNVIYDTNPQILGGTNVFKMWCTKNNGAGGAYYFESADGLTSWTAYSGNPVVAANNRGGFTTCFKVGSTYYLYGGAYPGGSGIFVQTSANGVTFGAATLAIPIGAGGTWEATGVAQLVLVPPFSGPTYYGYYSGALVHSALGLATSTDLINWTKSPSNPIIDFCAPGSFQYISGTYYMWSSGSYNAAIGAKGYNGLCRRTSSSVNGPWTAQTLSGTVQDVMYCSVQGDFDYGGTGTNALGTSMGDPSIVSALGNMYCYWTRSTNEVNNQYGINAAVATGVTAAQQVSTWEGMVGLPLPTPSFSSNLTTLASDNFVRADANPMGGNWTPLGTTGVFRASQIASNLVEPSTTLNNGDSFYNATSFPNDQWSQVTCFTATSAYNGASVRCDASTNEYRLYWLGGASGLNFPGTLTLGKVIAGTASVLASMTSLVVNVGDTLALAVSGSNMLGYWNGYPVLAATDTALTAGAAGLMTNPGAQPVTSSRLHGWSGGGLQASPFSPPSLGGSGYLIGSSNRCCSHGLSSQAVF